MINISEEFKSTDGWRNFHPSGFNFIDVFSGAGGLSCGLIMAGMTPANAIEFNKDAVETYNYNFKKFGIQIKPMDVTDEKVKQEIINSAKEQHIHLITGGFPCQGFSMQGKRIVTDPRNSLYLDLLEIIDKIRPDYILMENVVGLKSMLKGEVLKKILKDFESIGYKIKWKILNSADYGVPQVRKRIIFIGNIKGHDNLFPEPIYTKENYKTTGEFLKPFLTWEEDKDNNHIFWNTIHTKEEFEKIKPGEGFYPNYSSGWRKLCWDKQSVTVRASSGGLNIHPILNRLLTPRETAALQSFPEDFIFKGNPREQLKQIGNAVPCLLGKATGLAILKKYFFS